MQKAFRLYDKDKSGSIDVAEFRQIFSDLGFELTDEEFSRLLVKYDKDGDGHISYKEFNEIFGKVLHPQGVNGADYIGYNERAKKRKVFVPDQPVSRLSAEEVEKKLGNKIFGKVGF